MLYRFRLKILTDHGLLGSAVVAQRDRVTFGDAVRIHRPQPSAESLPGLAEQLERVRGRTLRGIRIRIGAVLLDEMNLKGSSDFISCFERFVDTQVP
jgi:hypothetical protein